MLEIGQCGNQILDALAIGIFAWTATGCIIFVCILCHFIYEAIKIIIDILCWIFNMIRVILSINIITAFTVYYCTATLLGCLCEEKKLRPVAKKEEPLDMTFLNSPMRSSYTVNPSEPKSKEIGKQYRLLKDKHLKQPLAQYIAIDKEIANPDNLHLYPVIADLIKDMGYALEEKEGQYFMRFIHD